MRRLILVRHSQSQIDPARPASQWSLSDIGRLRCRSLAQALRGYLPDVIVASREPKATETGALAAAILGVPFETAEGLHEHKREQVGFTSTEVFEQAVARFFDHPDNLVFGEETASQARERFERAVQRAIDKHAGQNVAIVSHGTVMSLFVAHHAGVKPFSFWKRLGMPALAIMSLPQLELLDVVDRLEIGD